jgi:hypothetical protein
MNENKGLALAIIHVVDAHAVQANHIARLGGIRQVQVLRAPDQPARVGPKGSQGTRRQTAQQKDPPPDHVSLLQILSG